MKELERFKKTVLEEYPRLGLDSRFCFRCHKGVPCFNECCRDINIFLTPYDIIRLKNNLGMNSEEFIKKYTITPFDQNLKYPILLLKMNDDEKKSCPFVGEEGCTVYSDRPWACRMYPLGLASPKENHQTEKDDFYFLLKEEVCKGFAEDNELSVKEWIEDQEIELYDRIGRGFKEITLHSYFQEEKDLSPQKMEMFFMVCYNIDKFREFVFKSTFLDKFEIDEKLREEIKKDDVALLEFGYDWLKFALFGEKTMTVKSDIMKAKQKELDKKQGN
jgi:Fe-S-cluster containining protein